MPIQLLVDRQLHHNDKKRISISRTVLDKRVIICVWGIYIPNDVVYWCSEITSFT